MSEFVEVKTAELAGFALNWFVAIAVRGEDRMPSPAQFKMWNDYHPSTDWAQGGPLLDMFDIAINGGVASGERVIYATLRAVDDGDPLSTATGPTRLVAACRAIVRNDLGDVVQVHADLAERK
jgi:hypothetical protein